MVSNSFTSPSFSRVPKLAERFEGLRDRPDALRQLALLVVVAAAGTLLLVVPEPNEDPVTIAALSDREANSPADVPLSDVADDSDAGDWLQRGRSATEPASEDNGGADRSAAIAAFAAANTPDLGLADPGETSPRPELTSTAATATSTTEATTTSLDTTAPSTTESPTTTAPTTEAPTTQAAPTSGQASTQGASSADTATSDVTGDPAAGDTTDGDTGGAEAEASSESDGSDDQATTTETAAPTTTTTTAPTTAAPDNGYVDAGNGVAVPPILLKIRFCESTDNYSAANPASSARGAYQFLTGSWAAYGHAKRYGVSQAHLASPAQQDEAALITWQADGTRPWLASKHCWG